MRTGQRELLELARILVLVGGIVLMLLGIVGIISVPIIGFVEGFFDGLGRLDQGILRITTGFIALLGIVNSRVYHGQLSY